MHLHPQLHRCCHRVCRGAQAFVVGGLVTSTPTEDVRTRTLWTSVTNVITRVGAGTATLGLSFLSGRSSFSHRERMPPPRGFSERCFPTPSFSKDGRRVHQALVQGFRRKTLRAPNFGRLPSLQARHTFEVPLSGRYLTLFSFTLKLCKTYTSRVYGVFLK